jgi:DNA-binding response OmpR family regulator
MHLATSPAARQPNRLQLDQRTLQLIGPKGAVDVSYSELCLLQGFIKTPSARQGLSEMFAHIGKSSTPETKKALEVQIARLRKKLVHAGASPPTIKAIRGIGYQLCVPVTVNGQNTP